MEWKWKLLELRVSIHWRDLFHMRPKVLGTSAGFWFLQIVLVIIVVPRLLFEIVRVTVTKPAGASHITPGL